MIRELFCRLTGYRYHYRINLKYRTKDHRPLCEITMTMKITSPKYIDDHRAVKKQAGLLLMKRVPRHYLCNGEIIFEPVLYLGLFKMQEA